MSSQAASNGKKSNSPVSRPDWSLMVRVKANRRTLILALGLTLAACGQTDPAAQSDYCVPTVPASVEPSGDPDRRIEDIIEYLTGERQTGDEDPVEETVDDPNFGGVWGDFEGGVVVAVLDCSEVDANKLAEMAGGSDSLYLIEVPYTFNQVNAYRDELLQELNEVGVEGDVLIDSTLEGRVIEVRVQNLESLPQSFGSNVPADVYEVVEGDIRGEE